MAQSYDRRINLYINVDGTQVQNNVKSIRAEMTKLVNAQKLMTIGSQEYVNAAQKIKTLQGILSKHTDQVRNVEKSWSFSKLADGFNKYLGVVTAFFASFAGVALTVKSAIQAYNEYDDKLADVMKTTGLTKDETILLSNELKKLDTRTSQQGLLDLARVAGKLGITGSKDIFEFVRAADQINVALSEDLGGNAEQAINELGKLVDIFKLKDEYGMELSLLKVGSAINSLGAAGTANEGYLVEFSKRVAGIAPSAGISIQNILGLATTLDELGQTSEVSGTVYNSVISAMFKDTATYANMARIPLDKFTTLLNTDANEAFIKVLEGAKGSGNGFAEMAINLDQLGLDGARSTSVLGVLADNIDKLREKQAYSNAEFEKGTSLTNEFNVKNETAQAKLEKAKKGFMDLTVQLGEKLTPAYTSVVGKSSLLLKVISGTIDFIARYSGAIVTLLAYFTAYTAAVKLQAMWEARANKEKLFSIVVGKLQTLAYKAQFAGIALYNAGLALLKGNLAAASVQFRAFSASLMANPIGLIVGLVAGLTVAIISYSGKLTAAQKAQKMMNDINLEAQKSIVDQKIQLGALLDVARNEKLSKEERIAAIKKLNELSPKYLGSLTLENIGTKEATEATNKYTESLLQNAKAQAAKEKLIEVEKELLDLQSGNAEDASTWLDKTWIAVKSGGNAALMAANTAAKAAELGVEKQDELIKKREKLLSITKQQVTEDLKTGGVVDPVTGTKTPKAEDEDAAAKARKKKIDMAEAEYAAKLVAIKKHQLETKGSEDQYQADMLNAEKEFLEKKLTIYKVGSKEYEETQVSLLEMMVSAEKKVNELLLKAQKELQDAKIENIQDGIEKQKAIEEERWKQELDSLKKQLIEKEKLSAEEIALNETTNKLIEEKTKTHEKNTTDLSNGAALQRKIDEAAINLARSDSDKKRWAAEREMAQAEYEQELAAANGNAKLIAQAERALSDKLIAIKFDELDKRKAIGDAIAGAADELFGTLIELAGKETAFGKAMFLFQQAAAIGQIVFNTAIANAKAVAASPLTAGMPWVGINTATAGISIASVIAQTIAGFSGGGYTGGSHKNKIAGFVHEDEWVASQELVHDSYAGPIIASLQRQQETKYSPTKRAVKSSRMAGFSSGGYASKPSASKSGGLLSVNSITSQDLKDFREAIREFRTFQPRLAIDLVQKGLNDLSDINKNRGL